jgi:DNA-damage-inducible protein D
MTKPTQTKKTVREATKEHISPFEQIRRTNDTGNEYWSSRDFAKVLNYSDYRNFEQVIAKARTACFNSGQRIDDHFVDVTEMVDLPDFKAVEFDRFIPEPAIQYLES